MCEYATEGHEQLASAASVDEEDEEEVGKDALRWEPCVDPEASCGKEGNSTSDKEEEADQQCYTQDELLHCSNQSPKAVRRRRRWRGRRNLRDVDVDDALVVGLDEEGRARGQLTSTQLWRLEEGQG